MKLILAGLAMSLMLVPVANAAETQQEKETWLGQQVTNLSIQTGIVGVCKNTNGQVTIYIGGRGSATASLVKVSRIKAEDQSLRIAELSATRAIADFIQANIDACLSGTDRITDSSLDLDGLIQKMQAVTDNSKLALQPADRAAVMQAVLGSILTNIRNSAGVQTVTTLQVKEMAKQKIRGMTLFGSNVGPKGDEVLAVEVFKWSPDAANYAAQAETSNKPVPGGGAGGSSSNQPFISHADDF